MGVALFVIPVLVLVINVSLYGFHTVKPYVTDFIERIAYDDNLLGETNKYLKREIDQKKSAAEDNIVDLRMALVRNKAALGALDSLLSQHRSYAKKIGKSETAKSEQNEAEISDILRQISVEKELQMHLEMRIDSLQSTMID